MNSAIPAAAIARTNRIIRKFYKYDALYEYKAKLLSELGLRESFIFKRLVIMGVIKETIGKKYYLDEAAKEEYQKSRWKRILVILVILIIVFLFISLQH